MGEKITDNEFQNFMNKGLPEQLVASVLSSPFSNRIKAMQTIATAENGMSLFSFIELEYLPHADIQLDLIGSSSIQEDIFNGYADKLMEKYRINFARLSEDELNKIANDEEYKNNVLTKGTNAAAIIDAQKVNAYQQENPKTLNELFGIEVKTENNSRTEYEGINEKYSKYIDNIGYASNKEIEETNKKVFGDEQKAKEISEQNAKLIMDVNITKEEDANFILNLYRLKDAVMNKDNYEPEIFEFEVQSIIEEIKKLMPNSRFAAEIVDEKGEVDVNTAMQFLDSFEKERNDTNLYTKLENLSVRDFSKFDKNEKINFSELLLRATRTDNEINIKLAENIAKRFGEAKGIELLDENGHLDVKKVEDLCRLQYGEDVDIEMLYRQSELNVYTANDKMNNIIEAIQAGIGVNCSSAEELNSQKETFAKQKNEIYNKKKSLVVNMIEGRGLNEKQIAALLLEFRATEMNERKLLNSQKGKIETTELQPGMIHMCQENGVAAILIEYMQANPDKFKDYLDENGYLSGKKTIELVNNTGENDKAFSTNQKIAMLSVLEEITVQTRKSDINFAKNRDVHDKVKKQLTKIEKKPKEEIDSKELEELYKTAKTLYKKDAITAETMERLQRLDENKFKETFGKTTKVNETTEALKRFWYGKMVAGGRQVLVTLPKAIFNKAQIANYNFGKMGEYLLNQKGNEKKRNTIIKNRLAFLRQKEERLNKRMEEEAKIAESASGNENLPVEVKQKTSIFDRIRGIFGRKEPNVSTNTIENGNVDNPRIEIEEIKVDEITTGESAQSIGTKEFVPKVDTPKLDSQELSGDLTGREISQEATSNDRERN